MTPRDLPGRMSKHVRVEGDCWEWTGAIQSRGYGSCADGQGGSMLAHRRAYEHLRGPIPTGLTIDHLCRNKACVNPRHMEAVTAAENVRRRFATQVTCKHGHPLEGDNLVLKVREDGNTYRVCVACQRTHSRATYDRLYVPTSGKRRAKRSAYRKQVAS